MNSIIKLILLILVITTSARAQKLSEKDSLLRIYTGKAARDSNFVKVLNSLSRAYRLSVPDSAINFSKQAYDLSVKLNYATGIATSLNYVGVAYFYEGDYPVAQGYQRKALEYSQAHHLDVQTSNALNSLALAYQNQGNHVSALESFLKALHYDVAAKNYFGQVKVLGNIGILWNRQGNFEKSIAYAKQALQLSDSLKDARAVKASLYNNIGLSLIELKKYAEGLVYVQKSKVLNQELGNRVFVVNCLNNIGYCYLNMGRLAEAEKYLTQGLEQARKQNAIGYLILSLLNLSEVYVKQHKPVQALPLSLESITLAKKVKDNHNLILNYRTIAAVYKELNQLSRAYQFLEKADILNDSLKNADVTQRISDLQKSYEVSEREAEIKLLEKDAELRKAALGREKDLRYRLMGMIAGLCGLAGFIYYSFSVKASLNKKLQKQNVEISEQKKLIEQINEDLKAQALRAQMNPHFIFNSLNSIQLLIFKKSNDRAYLYLSKFAKLLRKVLDNSEMNLVSLASEIETITLYLELESLRFNDCFTYEVKNEFDAVQAEQIKIMPLIVQPFIENAILHGLMQKEGDRNLRVIFSLKDDDFTCEVIDNGIGRIAASEISALKNNMHQSKGIRFTNERVNLFNSMNGRKSTIEVVDLMDSMRNAAGTRVKIRFQT